VFCRYRPRDRLNEKSRLPASRASGRHTGCASADCISGARRVMNSTGLGMFVTRLSDEGRAARSTDSRVGSRPSASSCVAEIRTAGRGRVLTTSWKADGGVGRSDPERKPPLDLEIPPHDVEAPAKSLNLTKTRTRRVTLVGAHKAGVVSADTERVGSPDTSQRPPRTSPWGNPTPNPEAAIGFQEDGL